jgi:phosphonate transport system ATP-binding protein
MPKSAAVITARALSVHYGGSAALRSVDLRIAAGERVAILGRSGAGKSTLIRALSGAVTPSSGSVTVCGVDLTTAPRGHRRRIRGHIGVVAQGLDLAGPLRVTHNVWAGRLGSVSLGRALVSLVWPRDLDRVRAVLADVDLDGYEFRRTDELSGGEQQRVAVARALFQRPSLMLADEPVANLDPVLATRIADALCAVASPDPGGCAVVMSLHNPDIARRSCDRALGVVEGRIAFDIACSDLRQKHLDLVYEPHSS